VEIESGEINIDGINISEAPLSMVRDAITIIP
jgi:ABC-type multidrug transport system fused ATPase/permease subunit